MRRLIDADALAREMYHKSFEVDDGRNVWNSGLWIRYKIFEEAIRDAPIVEAIPVDWIEAQIEEAGYSGYDMHAYELATMLEEWKEKHVVIAKNLIAMDASGQKGNQNEID